MPFDRLHRREFIALFGAAAAWPFVALAQQATRMKRIGALWGVAQETAVYRSYRMTFVEVLRDLGWTEGHNISIDNRWAIDADQLRTYATELVALAPNVLFGDSTPATAALLRQTHAIPIVFARVADPRGQDFVDSVVRPGRNVTGFTNFEPRMAGKWVELLKQLAPVITRVVLIYNPRAAPFTRSFLPLFEMAARSNGVKLIAAEAHSAVELESAIAEHGREPGGGLIAQPDPFLAVYRDLFISAAARHRLPAIYSTRNFVDVGGLVSYGNRMVDMYRGAATYVDRILRGAKPDDLPVQFPTNFELAINLKTARALGLEVPSSLLALADEVIE